MLIAQITDCHIVEPGALLSDRVDTAALLREAVAHVNALRPVVDLVLATGDLVNDGRADQYELLLDILGELDVPLLPIPGNHDDRTAMREAFGELVPDGGPGDDIAYVIDDHPLRLVGLDTTVPGEHSGRLDEIRLGWLDEVLAAAPDQPTLVFQHHPPFTTGIGWMDDVGLEGGAAQEALISRHPQVEAVVCGHVHRPIHTRFGGTVASTWPSTGPQVALALDGERYVYVEERAAVAVHHWHPSHGVRSHVSPVGRAATWRPHWADDADG